MAARIAVHGHFYQPPREDPWTGEIDRQPSAAPFHDWNERVHAESYLNMVFADLETDQGEQVVNNFERMSFDVGPTLMSWLERFHPRTYARILIADKKSHEQLGAGNAIAQAFHHTILPLSNVRDARTQIRWGIADFRYRFGRDPLGLWLPETAVNDDVLGILIDENIAFTVLAPWQAGRWRRPGDEWVDAATHGIDTRVPYRYLHRDNSGRSLTLFFYDGHIAQTIAFQNAMASAPAFIDMFESRADEPFHLIHAATDGETYGHHQKFGEIGLAYALFVEADKRDVHITNYAAHMNEYPAELEVELPEGDGTSWSCTHGVGRWKVNCGCVTGGEPGWNQEWRAPLRAGLEVIRTRADEIFERMGQDFFLDPWVARDRYVDVVIGATDLDSFLGEVASGPLDDAARGRAHALLELQRHSMSMFTSCGWFFADVAGIEGMQVLRYAARTIELIEELDQASPRDEALVILDAAKSNDPEAGTAAGSLAELLAR
ncbi:MAG: DUF3536 domain-containing protein [Actinomycetota bacterium]|nr:DUF3536 domain-containing protein [Actinomycetota bacterium]